MKYKNYNNYDKCRQWHKFHTHQKLSVRGRTILLPRNEPIWNIGDVDEVYHVSKTYNGDKILNQT